MKKILTTFFLSVIIIFSAFFLRIINLTILPVFADEAIYIRWSQVMNAESTLRFLPLSDGKQPLFMWVLMFMVNRFSDPLFIGRLLSVLTGILTAIGIFFLVLILFKSKKAAVFALFMSSFSPFLFFFSRMALVDSMLAMFGVWTVVLFLLTIIYQRFDLAMLSGFSLGFAFLTKSPAIFFLLFLPVVFLLNKEKFKSKKFYYFIFKSLLLFLCTVIIALAMYNILRLGPNFHMIGLRNKDYVLPYNHIFTNFKDPFVFHFDRAIEWIRILGPWPILLLALLSLFEALRKKKKEMFILFVFFMGPILIQSMYAKVFTARYILFTIPFLISIASYSILIKSKFIKIVNLFLIMFFTFLSFKTVINLISNPINAYLPRSERSGYLEEWTSGFGIKQVSEYLINKYKNENKKIVVGTEGYFGTLPDGLQMYLNNYKDIIVIGVGLDIKSIPDSLKESKDSGNPTFLVINTSRFKHKGDPEEIGLKLISSYEKAKRPEFVKEYLAYGEKEYLLFFEIK